MTEAVTIKKGKLPFDQVMCHVYQNGIISMCYQLYIGGYYVQKVRPV